MCTCTRVRGVRVYARACVRLHACSHTRTYGWGAFYFEVVWCTSLIRTLCFPGVQGFPSIATSTARSPEIQIVYTCTNDDLKGAALNQHRSGYRRLKTEEGTEDHVNLTDRDEPGLKLIGSSKFHFESAALNLRDTWLDTGFGHLLDSPTSTGTQILSLRSVMLLFSNLSCQLRATSLLLILFFRSTADS